MPQVINVPQDVALVLTSSIDVKGMTSSSRPDPRLRENDYAATLEYYLTEHPKVRRIIFIENSNWPLDRLRDLAQQKKSARQDRGVHLIELQRFPPTTR